jgi:hypothetical protein
MSWTPFFIQNAPFRRFINEGKEPRRRFKSSAPQEVEARNEESMEATGTA